MSVFWVATNASAKIDTRHRYPAARPETTEDILQRCLAFCPELAPPEIRAQRAPTVDDLRALILEAGVGLRPARKGGLRLEVEWVTNPRGNVKIPMVFNYGYAFSSHSGLLRGRVSLLDCPFTDIVGPVFSRRGGQRRLRWN